MPSERGLDLILTDMSGRSSVEMLQIIVCLLCVGHAVSGMAVDVTIPDELPVSTANLDIWYTDRSSGRRIRERVNGRYAVASPITPEHGRLVHVLTEDGKNDGCQTLINAPDASQGKWIALIQRGQCKFHDKVIIAAWMHNASAVVVYDHMEESDMLIMHHFIDDVVSVFVTKKVGEYLAGLVDDGVPISMNITLHKVEIYDTVSGTSKKRYKVQPLLIISVTMITCLIVGLTALLICGIRRAKSQHKKSNRRHVVFTINDPAVHQRLLMSDLQDYLVEPNNNDPNHNVINPHYLNNHH